MVRATVVVLAVCLFCGYDCTSIYVSVGGSSSNDCGSKDNPCGNIALGINASCALYAQTNSSNIVYVLPGTYVENSIEFSCPISLQSTQGSDSTYIQYNNTLSNMFWLQRVGVEQEFSISGFSLQKFNQSSQFSAIIIQNASSINISDIKCSNSMLGYIFQITNAKTLTASHLSISSVSCGSIIDSSNVEIIEITNATMSRVFLTNSAFVFVNFTSATLTSWNISKTYINSIRDVFSFTGKLQTEKSIIELKNFDVEDLEVSGEVFYIGYLFKINNANFDISQCQIQYCSVSLVNSDDSATVRITNTTFYFIDVSGIIINTARSENVIISGANIRSCTFRAFLRLNSPASLVYIEDILLYDSDIGEFFVFGELTLSTNLQANQLNFRNCAIDSVLAPIDFENINISLTSCDFTNIYSQETKSKMNSLIQLGGKNSENVTLTITSCSFSQLTNSNIIWVYKTNLSIISSVFDQNTCINTPITVSVSSFMMSNSNFTSNTGSTEFVYATAQNQTIISNCLFSGNKMDGPLLNFYVIDVIIIGCEFHRNRLGRGAAQIAFIVAGSCVLTLRDSYFSFNLGNWGSALHAINSDCIIEDSEFRKNDGIFGGTFYVNKGNTTISRCLFYNSGGTIGGVINTGNTNNLFFSDSLIIDAGANREAGAIFIGGYSKATVSNVTMTGCSASLGGSIVITEFAHATFTDCKILNSTASSSGGGIIVSNHAKANFSRMEISNCEAASTGSAVYLQDLSSTIIEDSLFSYNYSPTEGGAIYAMDTAAVELNKVEFLGNNAKTSGGAIFLTTGSTAIVNDCLFDGNSCDSMGGTIVTTSETKMNISSSVIRNSIAIGGGAIYATDYSGIILSNCSLYNNSASSRGGGILGTSSSEISILSSVLDNNCANDGTGGAIALQDFSSGIFTNSAFVSNSASSAGAIYYSASSFTKATNCTVSYNTAELVGGGIIVGWLSRSLWIDSTIENNSVRNGAGGGCTVQDSANISFYSSVFRNNSANIGGGIFTGDTSTTSVYNSLFTENQAKLQGGGIEISQSSFFIARNTEFSQNFAAKMGAGLFIQGGIDMDGSYVASNTAETGGGIMILYRTDLAFVSSVTNSMIFNNHAVTGGGIAAYELQQTHFSFPSWNTSNLCTSDNFQTLSTSNVYIFNNITIQNNTAAAGAAIFIDSPKLNTPTFYNSSFINNNAHSFGGAILFGFYLNPTKIMQSCVFLNNTAKYGACNVGFVKIADIEDAKIFCSNCSYSKSFPIDTYQDPDGFATGPKQLGFASEYSCRTTMTLNDASDVRIDVVVFDDFSTKVHGLFLVDFPVSVQLSQPSDTSVVFISDTNVVNLESDGIGTFNDAEVCGPNNSTMILLFEAKFDSLLFTIENSTCETLLYGCSSGYTEESSKNCGSCDNCDTICVATETPGVSDIVVILLLVCFSLIVVICCIAFVFIGVRYRKQKQHEKYIALELPDFRNLDSLTITDILADPEIPKLPWDEIEIGPAIGKGASGLVSKGTWYNSSGSSQDIALKELILGLIDIPQDVIEEFIIEIKCMNALVNPNIVQFLGVCTSPNSEKLFLVTELMHYGSVHDLMGKKGQNLTQKLRLKICIGAAKGVAYLHEKKLIHRDLKTQNLLVNNAWVCKVADFGISRVKPDVTRAMTCIGTPVYMAPEVLAKNKYSEKADVYSFGIVLAEIFTGLVPYSDSINIHLNQAQLITQIMNDNLRPPIAGLHPALKQLIRDCWNSEPELRPRFPEIVIRLRRLKGEEILSDPGINPEIGENSTNYSSSSSREYNVSMELSSTEFTQ